MSTSGRGVNFVDSEFVIVLGGAYNISGTKRLDMKLLSQEKERSRDKARRHPTAFLDNLRRHNSDADLASLLNELTQETKKLLKADLVSILLLDREKCELFSVVSQDGRNIRFDARLGIAGAAALRGETIIVANAYDHPLFYKEIDSQTGYRTRSVIAAPIKNPRGVVIGVCQAINKKTGRFKQKDIEILETCAAQAAEAIETAQFTQPLKEEDGRLQGKDRLLERELGGGFSTQNIIGTSPKIQAVIRLIDQIRESLVDVLIEGESGTGKELVAKALHFNSPWAKGPFVALNCAALPENLIESELFGIERGVATGVDPRMGKFEQAQGGTLFLDEIGDLSPTAQAKILRVLQERVFHRVGGRMAVSMDARIIAATNRNLETAIRQGKFREDLYYRLRVIHIHMPPLREVREDIPLLAQHFLSTYCEAMGKQPKRFTSAALQRLTRCSWPGNVRQLENEVKRLVASVRSPSITENNLDPRLRTVSFKPETPEPVSSNRSLRSVVEELEKRTILDVLSECNGNKHKTALALGLSRQGLLKKMNRYGIA